MMEFGSIVSMPMLQCVPRFDRNFLVVNVPGVLELCQIIQNLLPGQKACRIGKKHIGPRDAYPFEDLGDLPKDRDANEDAVIRTETYIQKAIRAEAPFCLVVASNDGHGPYTHGDRSRYPANTIQTPHGMKTLRKIR